MSTLVEMKTSSLPIKKEKLSDRLCVLISPELKRMIKEAENNLKLDVPVFVRELLTKELQKLLKA